MTISLRQALRLAVGPANVDAAGHAVADWLDSTNWSDAADAADMIRTALDQPAPAEPASESSPEVPHGRPDTSLRAELMGLIETQRQVILGLAERVDRLEMRADQLTPMERVERRWDQEAVAREADAPAAPESRKPAAVAAEPSDEELREIYEMGHLPTAEELVNDNGEDDLGFLCTSAYYRWLEENPAEMARHEAKCLRAVFNAGVRWGSASPQPISVSERLPEAKEMTEDGCCWVWNVTAYTWGLFRLDPIAHSHWLPFNALP